MTKILIWGTGERAEKYIRYNYFKDCDVLGFVDTYKKADEFMGKPVFAVSKLSELIDSVDYVVVATYYFAQVVHTCVEIGVPKEKLVLTDIIQEELFDTDQEVIKTLSPMAYNDMLLDQYKLIRMNQRDFMDENRLLGKGKYAGYKYMTDYFRYRTFEFVADEIANSGIEGALAEFGVYRGAFSSLISEKFPERKIYLFDTFEGFDKDEAKREANLGRSDERFENTFTNTNVEIVLSGMKYPKQCIVCKGLFPGSVTAEAAREQYAFVSIDVDFENSIYEGLKFFYPRLSRGGYIFLHDYNSAYLLGVKQAVQKYEQETGSALKKVPLADRAGTLIIVK